MAKESEKLDIEDIKDPLDEVDKAEEVDLEAVVEEDEPAKEEAEPDELEKAQAEPKENEPEAPVEEKPVASEAEKKETKPKKPKKPFPWKTLAIVVITVLVTGALILGGIYYYQKYKAPKPVEETPTPTNNVEINVTPKATVKTVYVTANPSLNLRKEPNTSAEILTTIPFGTKIDVIETQSTWYKTTYNSQTGWVDSSFTATANPLVYQNADYKFQITFPADWAGYKLFPITGDASQTAAWYVGLPTADTSYVPTGVDKGYASMFAVSVYTPTQWTALQNEGGPTPTLAVQNQQWVVAYSLPNGTVPKDLTTQAAETKNVVKTIKFY